MTIDPAAKPDLAIDAAARLGGCRGRVLLHSARDDDGLGRRSFVAAEPSRVLVVRGAIARELDARGEVVFERRLRDGDEVFELAEAFLARHGSTLGAAYDADAPEPRVIGYFGYELGPEPGHNGPATRRIGPVTGRSGPDGGPPDLWLAAYGAVARIDARGLAVVGPDAAARARLAELLARPRAIGPAPRFDALAPDDSDHPARVANVRDRIALGTVYQVNLARRLVAREHAAGDPLALYAALAEVAPAPYGGLLELDGAAVISGSPERFLAAVGDRVETRPIKGTLARGATATAAELAASPKDAAEHLMIVDLERNDLGRIAELGSVAVDRLAYTVELPALYHVVSRVSAHPRAGTGYAALLRATFPGGSITGAPKLAAMQIIAELEPVRRGPYCGALGYFGAGGAFDLAIAIRIGVLADRALAVHVGGGIVADSSPEAELDETDVKARGWRAALAQLDGQN